MSAETSPGRALIVVDVQVDFCEGGALPVPGGAAVADRVGEYIKQGGGEYSAIVATKDWHIDPGEHFSDSPDWVDTWPPHCRAGSPGTEFHANLLAHVSPASDFDAVFLKGEHSPAYSGFEGHDDAGQGLEGWLRSKGLSAVDCVGIATRGCVKATAESAVLAGFETRVLLDMCADPEPSSDTQAAIDAMKSGGIDVVGS